MEDDNLDIYVVNPENKDKPYLINTISGYERFACNIALKIASAQITNLPKSNFLMIDEGFDSADCFNLSKIGSLFDYLKLKYDFVLIVSHLDGLKEYIDNFIEIKKVNGFSRISRI